MDLRLDDNQDLVFYDNDLQLTTTVAESLAQRLKVKLLTFYGEWFLDEDYGIDYFGSIFGKNRSKEAIDTIFQEAVLSEKDVTSIVYFKSHIENQGRIYKLSFSVTTNDSAEAIPVDLKMGVSPWLD